MMMILWSRESSLTFDPFDGTRGQARRSTALGIGTGTDSRAGGTTRSLPAATRLVRLVRLLNCDA